MSIAFPEGDTAQDSTQRRLLILAGTFLFLYSVVLTLSPAVRVHSFQAQYRWEHWIGFTAWLAGFTLLYRQVNKLLPNHDPFLLPIASFLSGWGLLTIYRLSLVFGLRQTLWLIVGLSLVYLLLRIPRILDILRRYKYLWLFVGLALTGLTFFLGTYPGGSGPRLWLGCCGVYLQPSEPLKILLIVYLAGYLASQVYFRLTLPQLLAPTLVLVAAAIILLVAQRDLGTAILVISIYTIVVYMASARRRVLIISLILMVAAAFAGYATIAVIKARVDSWINPWLDSAGKSYQLVQSFLAVATGRIFGTGPGLGSPGLVPVAHSDFITSAIAEETGLLGVIGLLLVIAIFVFRCLDIAMRAANNYHRFLAAGLGGYIGFQSVLIIGGNLRMLPLTGVTLPFVSYGGSSLVTAFLAFGMLLIISSNEEPVPPEMPRLRPYLVTGGGIAVLLLGLGLTAGWWGVVRSDDLQFRTDNLRWTVHSRYVPRGSLLDRNNAPIAITTGNPGNYTRSLLIPALSTTIGYSDPLYGKGGLEGSLDGYLSGLQGNSASTIWLAEWIYGQPPAGLDVRLAIDLKLQDKLDSRLQGHVGAAVVMNSHTGEINSLASQPSFDPNQMSLNMEAWRNDPFAPLLNRVTQGAYPPGTILGPFFYAQVQPRLQSAPIQLTFSIGDQTQTCAIAPSIPLTWESEIAAGCPGTLVELGSYLSSAEILQSLQEFGFFMQPAFELPTNSASTLQPVTDSVLTVLGQSGIKVTPLQMVLATAQLSNHGARPSPRLSTAVKTPHQGWVVLPAKAGITTAGKYAQPEGIKTTPKDPLPIWDAIGRAQTDDGKPLVWYIGATIDTWPGSPMAIALVLEEDNPNLALEIGRETLRAALNP